MHWRDDVEVVREHVCPPELTRVFPYCFSPDGTKLAALGMDSQLIYIWDLPVLRTALKKELDLDWDAPPYPPAAPGPTQPPKVIVKMSAG